MYEFKMPDIDGKEVKLERFKGKVVIIVNVASKCGLTPQYKGLEALHRKYKDRGLVVLGFPCNQFRGQEPGTEAEIKQFCKATYDVSFPLFAKIDVNGPNAHPLYGWLKASTADKGEIEWNFAKFLVGKDGKVLKRFKPQVKPADLESEIVTAFGSN
jgi:glutathione peroxidase